MMRMAQHTDPQEEGKCVWRRVLYVSLSVTLYVCERKREGTREEVLSMLPSFLITSVS